MASLLYRTSRRFLRRKSCRSAMLPPDNMNDLATIHLTVHSDRAEIQFPSKTRVRVATPSTAHLARFSIRSRHSVSRKVQLGHSWKGRRNGPSHWSRVRISADLGYCQSITACGTTPYQYDGICVSKDIPIPITSALTPFPRINNCRRCERD